MSFYTALLRSTDNVLNSSKDYGFRKISPSKKYLGLREVILLFYFLKGRNIISNNIMVIGGFISILFPIMYFLKLPLQSLIQSLSLLYLESQLRKSVFIEIIILSQLVQYLIFLLLITSLHIINLCDLFLNFLERSIGLILP